MDGEKVAFWTRLRVYPRPKLLHHLCEWLNGLTRTARAVYFRRQVLRDLQFPCLHGEHSAFLPSLVYLLPIKGKKRRLRRLYTLPELVLLYILLLIIQLLYEKKQFSLYLFWKWRNKCIMDVEQFSLSWLIYEILSVLWDLFPYFNHDLIYQNGFMFYL